MIFNCLCKALLQLAGLCQSVPANFLWPSGRSWQGERGTYWELVREHNPQFQRLVPGEVHTTNHICLWWRSLQYLGRCCIKKLQPNLSNKHTAYLIRWHLTDLLFCYQSNSNFAISVLLHRRREWAQGMGEPEPAAPAWAPSWHPDCSAARVALS